MIPFKVSLFILLPEMVVIFLYFLISDLYLPEAVRLNFGKHDG